jgi:integrase/recombinase XerD
MTPQQDRPSPTVKRMAEQMRVRNLSANTIKAYTRQVENFERHFSKTVDELGPEEIHQYQLYLVDVKKASWSQFNLTGMMHLFLNMLLGRELIDLDCRLAGDSVKFLGPLRLL